MAEMTLRCGVVTLIDEADKLLYESDPWNITPDGYVYKGLNRVNGVARIARLHRLIAGAKAGEYVDHIDRNRLNNQRENLRIATPSENQGNMGKRSTKTSSKHKGVSFNKQYGRWRAYIRPPGGKKLQLGEFEMEDEAAHAYNKAAIKHFGEFACLNPIGKDKEAA